MPQTGRPSAVIAGKLYTRYKLLPLREKLRKHSEPWHFQEFSQHGLTHQMCRFCGCGFDKAPRGGLWKYAVRHYICDTCRTEAGV